MPGYDLPSHYWNHEAPWKLEGNQVLPSFRLAYETWGSLSKGRDNAVLFLHALSGSSHAFSSPLSSQPGWWDGLLDDDSPIQPRTHFIICANLLGGCYGSTGPSSVDPHSGIRYGARFPQITTGDMLETQRALVRALGVDGPLTLIGGSLGGMLVLEWAVKHPEDVKAAIAMVAPGKSYSQAIALRSAQREAILADPHWNGGDCYEGSFPETGISLARKIGMITYRSSQEFELRFARQERNPRLHFLEGQFEVQSYLDHQGKKFAERFDPNTYLYFSRAMDLYDLGKGYPSFEEAVGRITARTLLVAVSSDFLVPLEQVNEVHETLQRAGRDSRLAVLDSVHGHDSFLMETEMVREELKRFFRDQAKLT